MNKLQLYIYKSVRGFKSVQNINPAENVQRHIRENRAALSIINYDPAEKYLFYLINYVENGTFLTILRTIPDKPLDHLASTIFVPNGMLINREDLAEIVNRTTRMVSNPSVSSEEINELHELFAKEYPVEPEPAAVVESQGREYAFSYYGGDTGRNFEDFLGDRLYQTEFLKYAGVVLVDADLGVAVDATNLSNEPLYEPATILPPEPANGFRPHLYGRTFDRPFRVSLGKEVEIVWKRKGFDDIRQTVEVNESEQTVEPESLDGSRKTITRSTFYVTGHGGKKPVEDAEITVNGAQITGEHSFSFDELKNADVVVSAKGYRPYRATLDLAATSQALVSLHEQKRIYGFELPVKSSELGAPIRFEIHTKRELAESPLEGYALLDDMKEGAGRFNHLQYTGSQPGVPVRMTFIYIAAALVAGFLLGWLIMSSGNKDNNPAVVDVVVEQPLAETVEPEKAKPVQETPQEPKQAEEKAPEEPKATVDEQPSQNTNAPSENVTAEAIAYLDNNTKWTRDDLDKHPGLAGLFDDMNNFRLERLYTYWGPRLEKSSRFKKVATHARQGFTKKIFKPEGTYCTGNGDRTITVQSYLNRIDPAKN